MTRGKVPEASRPPVTRGEIVVIALLIAGIVATRWHSYVLFHTLIEFFTIAICLTAFTLVWNTRRHLEDRFLFVFGLAVGPATIVDMLHALAYKGMGVFAGGANLPTQLWIAFRVLHAVGALAATVPMAAPRAGVVMSVFSAISALLVAAIFGGLFPDCFVDGQGLTAFKVGMEYVVMAAFAVAGVLLWRDRTPRASTVRHVGLAIMASAVLESAAFTLYVDVYGAFNMVGHVFGLVNAVLLYVIVAWKGLSRPQGVLYARMEAQRRRFATDAERANRDIVRFSEVLAHHLQEPVRQQHVFCQRLASALPTPLSTEGAEALRFVMDGAIRLQSLVRDARRYLSYAQMTPAEDACDGNQALDAALAAIGPQIAASHAVVRKSAIPPVLIETGSLTEVFSVLVENAIVHRDPERSPEITIAAERLPDAVEISVSDNGSGIAPEFRERVFRVFERIETRNGEEGTGIGLALARRIVEASGGRIWIRSATCGGTSVHFTLRVPDTVAAE